MARAITIGKAPRPFSRRRWRAAVFSPSPWPTTPPADPAHPEAEITDFSPAFTNYAVVVLNYNGQDWPAATRTNFESYMTNGGGMVSVHAADNSFPAWPAYNLMTGVGGCAGAMAVPA